MILYVILFKDPHNIKRHPCAALPKQQVIVALARKQISINSTNIWVSIGLLDVIFDILIKKNFGLQHFKLQSNPLNHFPPNQTLDLSPPTQYITVTTSMTLQYF